MFSKTPVQIQFDTSSVYGYPDSGYTLWKICNDYPSTAEHDDYPWLQYDPMKDSEKYLNTIKEYCFEGMINNDFDPWKNKCRNWYNAPWMHYGPAGREPLHGLTTERFVPPLEFAATQRRYVQNWALALYNSKGATVFEKMWGAKSREPTWNENIDFPDKTVMCKLLWTDATTKEFYILDGAPSWDAMIAVRPTDPNQMPDQGNRVKYAPTKVNLLQVDFAVKDERTITGWVWSTIMYAGKPGDKEKQGYKGFIPVGLSWGNDPKITQKEYEAGKRPKEVWFNSEANDILKKLNGVRPFWGWNGRLAGPIDHFISSCQSCHSTSEWIPARDVQGTSQVPPAPSVTAGGQFIPVDDAVTMTWFQNIPCGTPITKGALSADYSFQLMIGHERYLLWKDGKEGDGSRRRQGPKIKF